MKILFFSILSELFLVFGVFLLAAGCGYFVIAMLVKNSFRQKLMDLRRELAELEKKIEDFLARCIAEYPQSGPEPYASMAVELSNAMEAASKQFSQDRAQLDSLLRKASSPVELLINPALWMSWPGQATECWEAIKRANYLYPVYQVRERLNALPERVCQDINQRMQICSTILDLIGWLEQRSFPKDDYSAEKETVESVKAEAASRQKYLRAGSFPENHLQVFYAIQWSEEIVVKLQGTLDKLSGLKEEFHDCECIFENLSNETTLLEERLLSVPASATEYDRTWQKIDALKVELEKMKNTLAKPGTITFQLIKKQYVPQFEESFRTIQTQVNTLIDHYRVIQVQVARGFEGLRQLKINLDLPLNKPWVGTLRDLLKQGNGLKDELNALTGPVKPSKISIEDLHARTLAWIGQLNVELLKFIEDLERVFGSLESKIMREIFMLRFDQKSYLKPAWERAFQLLEEKPVLQRKDNLSELANYINDIEALIPRVKKTAERLPDSFISLPENISPAELKKIPIHNNAALCPSIVRIVNPQTKEVTGVGILISPDHVITCAHTIPGCKVNWQKMQKPAEQVRIEFPFIMGPGLRDESMLARVHYWGPTDSNREFDFAGLLLEHPAPEGTCPAPLLENPNFEKVSVRICGFPKETQNVVYAAGMIAGMRKDGDYLIDSKNESYKIRAFHDGAPVWSNSYGGVIGILTTDETRDDVRNDVMISIAQMKTCFPDWFTQAQLVKIPKMRARMVTQISENHARFDEQACRKLLTTLSYYGQVASDSISVCPSKPGSGMAYIYLPEGAANRLIVMDANSDIRLSVEGIKILTYKSIDENSEEENLAIKFVERCDPSIFEFEGADPVR